MFQLLPFRFHPPPLLSLLFLSIRLTMRGPNNARIILTLSYLLPSPITFDPKLGLIALDK